MNLKEIGRRAHENAKSKGFYDNPPSVEMRLLLIHSEISEACEAHRKSKFPTADPKWILGFSESDFLESFTRDIKSSFWDEIADVVIRCCDFAASEGQEITIEKDPVFEAFDAENIAATLNELHDQVSWASSMFGSGHDEAAWGWIDNVVESCFKFARVHGIDLEAHIEAKMRYNSMRPPMHGGKAY